MQLAEWLEVCVCVCPLALATCVCPLAPATPCTVLICLQSQQAALQDKQEPLVVPGVEAPSLVAATLQHPSSGHAVADGTHTCSIAGQMGLSWDAVMNQAAGGLMQQEAADSPGPAQTVKENGAMDRQKTELRKKTEDLRRIAGEVGNLTSLEDFLSAVERSSA